MKRSVCFSCGKTFTMGVDGVELGGKTNRNSFCDECAGVARSKDGYAISVSHVRKSILDVAARWLAKFLGGQE